MKEIEIPEGYEAKIKGNKVIIELKESKDERIKNDIMEAVENWLPYERVEEIRAYLEKQKEQKPVDIKIDNPNVQKFDTDVKVTTSDSSAGGKELLYVCNKSYDIGFHDGVASVKPAEWSEEDEYVINEVLHRVKTINPTSILFEKVPKKQFIASLKSLRLQHHWKPSEEQISALEDAKMRMFLIGYGLCPLLQTLINDLKKL